MWSTMYPETHIHDDMETSNTAISKHIMIVAGETSGDLHGGKLVKAMHRIDPGLRFYGVGGKNLKEAGVALIADSSDMAVVGLTEVFSRLGTIIRVMRHLKASIRESRPDLVILIDYPDFNLSLAKTAKKNGIKVFYYISPQVWAWRKGRIGEIKKNVDKMAVILPFEASLYHAAGVDATFVGHPLLDEVKTKYSREETIRRLGLQSGVTTVGILPGSRQAEIIKHLPEMIKAAQIIERKISPVQFVMPLVETSDTASVSNIIRQFPVKVRIVRDAVYDVIHCTDIVMVASGTATLETALMETPMVIIYKLSAPSYYIGKMIINIDHIGLVNIIAGRTVVPELIQDDANAERIATEIINILTNRERLLEIKSQLSEIRSKLGSPGAAERAARLAYDML
jgi:lipid-A-disaccharide synthase